MENPKELRIRLEALKSEKILTVSRLEDVKVEALNLAEEAITSLEKFLERKDEDIFSDVSDFKGFGSSIAVPYHVED
ncbi:MAG: hypothetical protein J5507_00135 [Clostridia bacterium]|nr:hypothetical protein [Clostridia bacterium]